MTSRNPSDLSLGHSIGKRDAVAETLMLVRSIGANKAIKELTKQLLIVDPDHLHAKWVLENI